MPNFTKIEQAKQFTQCFVCAFIRSHTKGNKKVV